MAIFFPVRSFWAMFPPRGVLSMFGRRRLRMALQKRRGRPKTASHLGGGRGTLALRSSFSRLRSCGYRQLANGSCDILAVLLAILNRYASSSGQSTVALGLRV